MPTMSPSQRITLTAIPYIPFIHAGDDLATILMECAMMRGWSFQHGDILVIAQKIVSKAEGRTVRLSGVEPSERAKEIAAEAGKDARLVEIILRESREILRIRPGLIVVEQRLGLICANAGIDRSNVESLDGQEAVTLLPVDPDQSARSIRARIVQSTGQDVAVIINDSHGRPWRHGTVGVAIGIAGLMPLEEMAGQRDLFGYTLQHTVVNFADQIAAAASLLMGQGSEGQPAVLVRGARWRAGDGTARQLLRDRSLDMFR